MIRYLPIKVPSGQVAIACVVRILDDAVVGMLTHLNVFIVSTFLAKSQNIKNQEI
jgi:hypothetical protein